MVGDESTYQLFFDSISYTIVWCMLREFTTSNMSGTLAQISLSTSTSSPHSINTPLNSAVEYLNWVRDYLK